MPRARTTTETPPVAAPKPPLPNGWKWVRFDQIAHNISERVDDPRQAGVDHYVGLEHLDSDSLKIRRWGTPEDVEAQKLRFRPGDIIFGKRRAYQRKVGVAEFDGICSAHAFVFRGNADHIVPELLPFFMQTDAFMERAVAISKGSLSPTINWGDLARQEFALPSDPAEQRRIAELLRAADEAVEAWREVELSIIGHRNSSHHHHLCYEFDYHPDLHLPARWVPTKVSDACHIDNTLRFPINEDDRAGRQGDYPYYGPTGILDHLDHFRVEGDYVLIGEDGDHFLKFADWSMTQLVSGRFNANNHVHLLRGGPKCRLKWLFYYFKHRDIQKYLTRQGAGRLKLTKASLSSMQILLPSLPEQDRLIERFDAIESMLTATAMHKGVAQAIYTQILSHLLTPPPETP